MQTLSYIIKTKSCKLSSVTVDKNNESLNQAIRDLIGAGEEIESVLFIKNEILDQTENVLKGYKDSINA